MASAVRNEAKIFNWKNKQNLLTVPTVPEHDDCLVVTGKKTHQGKQEMKRKSVLAYNEVEKKSRPE